MMEDIIYGNDTEGNQEDETAQQQIMMHMTEIGQQMTTAVQQGTDTLTAHLNVGSLREG